MFSLFDFATLATKHRLHLPYQAMDVFLSRCNVELCVSGKQSLAGANEAFQKLRLSLYSSGVSPFLCPFVTTYSINDYSGINSRDSETLRAKMYPGISIDNAIAALREIGGPGTVMKKRRGRPPGSGKAKKRTMTSEGRERQREAMRRYWAEKKAAGNQPRKSHKKRTVKVVAAAREAE